MLCLPADLATEIIARCDAAYPQEGCGILAGPAHQPPDDLHATRHIPLSNVADEPEQSFALDPADQLAAYAEMDQRGEDPVAVYHSHPHGDARPSAIDLAASDGTGCLWLIVSMRNLELRAWRITGGQAHEEGIRVVSGEPRPSGAAGRQQ